MFNYFHLWTTSKHYRLLLYSGASPSSSCPHFRHTLSFPTSIRATLRVSALVVSSGRVCGQHRLPTFLPLPLLSAQTLAPAPAAAGAVSERMEYPGHSLRDGEEGSNTLRTKPDLLPSRKYNHLEETK